MKCLCCEDEGWVCENHPDQPFTGPHACNCGGAGMPCPACNPSTPDEPPRLPKGFEPDSEWFLSGERRGGSSEPHSGTGFGLPSPRQVTPFKGANAISVV